MRTNKATAKCAHERVDRLASYMRRPRRGNTYTKVSRFVEDAPRILLWRRLQDDQPEMVAAQLYDQVVAAAAGKEV